MPHSAHWSASTVIEHVVKAQPRSVMDVGCGYGKWGFLIREALDFVADRHAKSEWEADRRTRRIRGRIATTDVGLRQLPSRDVLALEEAIDGYDLVMLGDVIEHIEKEQGERLIASLVARNGCVLINTPREFFAQGAVLGNPYETHRSLWSPDDFKRWPAEIDIRGGTLTVALRGTRNYPSDAAVHASSLVRRFPGLRNRGAAATAVKAALRLYVFR